LNIGLIPVYLNREPEMKGNTRRRMLKSLSESAKFAYLALYGTAMGLFEAVLVIYLRLLYYPEGFTFPLAGMSPRVLQFELLRELSTLVMIAAVAMIASAKRIRRLAWFLYIFAVWDICYYLFLKLLIGWPESFLTWDILFLIPVTWVGPVLAPLICSATMIIMACCLLCPRFWGLRVKTAAADWLLIYGGAGLIFISFVKDYSLLIIRGGFLSGYFDLPGNTRFMRAVSQYVPESFDWILFFAGEVMILAGLFLMVRRTVRTAEIVRQV
jgi:hypothetical protein